LIQSIDTLPEDINLGAWLATVARRHTWRLLERKRREVAGKHGSSSESTTLLSNGGTEDLEHWELTVWLNKGLSIISGSCRDRLSVLYFGHLTVRLLHAWAWLSVAWDPPRSAA
jgi:hypothetical protein